MSIWTKQIDVPFVSQIYPYADASPNDCGIAALLMLIRYSIKRSNGIVPSIPTVNDVEAFSPLAQRPAPKGLTFANIIELGKQLGFKVTYMTGLKSDIIISYLNNNQPLAMLCEYDHINPTDVFNGAHFVVVKGYNDSSFLINDPYHLGENAVISKPMFDTATRTVVGNSGLYQGFMVG